MLSIKSFVSRCALVLAGLIGSAMPAFAETPTLTPQRLLERLDRLEAQNAQLRKEIDELRQQKETVTKRVASEPVPAPAPEIATRLETVEKDVQAMKKPVAIAEKLDGISVSATVTGVWQKASGLPRGTDANDKFNYNANLAVEVPLESVGKLEHKIYAEALAGQGQGLNETLGLLGHHNVPNHTAFQASGAAPDDALFILAQAWYQAAMPLGNTDSQQKAELTFGKIDVLGFFDQNEVAGDETTQFINTVFVHNPLLDAGGEVGADANGYQPGVIAAYVNERDAARPWRLSVGVFGAGEKGANYEDTADSPLVIAQAEKTLSFNGRTGNYRFYAWTRRDVPKFTDESISERHTGLGISIDQQLSDGVKVFGRYGQLIHGKLHIERALALGTEIGGSYWGREADSVGIAASQLWASHAYKRAGGEGFLNKERFESGTPDFTFRPSGAEQVAEIYYRYQFAPQFAITPDFQWIRHGGANKQAGSVTVIGVRANIAY